jgi:hypothetical protein
MVLAPNYGEAGALDFYGFLPAGAHRRDIVGGWLQPESLLPRVA